MLRATLISLAAVCLLMAITLAEEPPTPKPMAERPASDTPSKSETPKGETPPIANPETETTKSASKSYREGTKLADQEGYFKLSGDRATFYAANGMRLLGLENLNLERVVRAISDNPNPVQWKVSGVVTEYRGGNYLLITRAIALTKPAAAGKARSQ